MRTFSGQCASVTPHGHSASVQPIGSDARWGLRPLARAALALAATALPQPPQLRPAKQNHRRQRTQSHYGPEYIVHPGARSRGNDTHRAVNNDQQQQDCKQTQQPYASVHCPPFVHDCVPREIQVMESTSPGLPRRTQSAGDLFTHPCLAQSRSSRICRISSRSSLTGLLRLAAPSRILSRSRSRMPYCPRRGTSRASVHSCSVLTSASQ